MGVDRVVARQLGDDRLAEDPLAPRIRVVGLSPASGASERLDDMRRGVEVGLAALQVHHGQTGLLPGPGGGHDAAQIGGGAKQGAVGKQVEHGLVLSRARKMQRPCILALPEVPEQRICPEHLQVLPGRADLLGETSAA